MRSQNNPSPQSNPAESQRSRGDSNISMLSLLTLPAVAAFAGCGARPEPIEAALSNVIASPEKYVGEFLRVKGFAREGKPNQYTIIMPMSGSGGPRAAGGFWPMGTCSVEHRLFVSNGQQDQALYLRDAHTFLPFSSPQDFFKRNSGIDLREISVTGTLVVADSPSGYALRVVDILK